MPRSEKEWKVWFEKRERRKAPKRRLAKEKGAEQTQALPPLVARVIGQKTFFNNSWKRSRVLDFADWRRRNPTPAEAELSRILCGLNGGVLRGKFTREHVVSGKWIVDFFFPEIRLAIEVDGSIHLVEQQLKRDRLKDADCKRFDITVLRLTNRDVAGNRESLVAKLRVGWRRALQRKNRVIGLSAEDYLGRESD